MVTEKMISNETMKKRKIFTRSATLGSMSFVMGLIVYLTNDNFKPFSMVWPAWYFLLAMVFLTFDAVNFPGDAGYKALTVKHWRGAALPLWQTIVLTIIAVFIMVFGVYVGFIAPVKSVRAPKEMPREIAWLMLGSFVTVLSWYLWIKNFVMRVFSISERSDPS